jgi:hypothetical protein
MCNVDLGLLVVTDQESEPTSSPGQYKADEATLVPITNPQAIYTNNWT